MPEQGYNENMYAHNCKICGQPFQSVQPTTLTCSKFCNATRLNQITGRQGYKNIESGTVGAISEMLVASDLMKKGYSVFRSLSPSCYCDLIATKNSKLYKVEVKTGYISVNTGKICKPAIKNNIYDILAIYIRIHNKVYYMDKDDKFIDI